MAVRVHTASGGVADGVGRVRWPSPLFARRMRWSMAVPGERLAITVLPCSAILAGIESAWWMQIAVAKFQSQFVESIKTNCSRSVGAFGGRKSWLTSGLIWTGAHADGFGGVAAEACNWLFCGDGQVGGRYVRIPAGLPQSRSRCQNGACRPYKQRACAIPTAFAPTSWGAREPTLHAVARHDFDVAWGCQSWPLTHFEVVVKVRSLPQTAEHRPQDCRHSSQIDGVLSHGM